MSNGPGRPKHPDILTPAEWRVLELIQNGRTNPEIARELDLSVNTVRYHVSNILGKLELRSRHEARDWRRDRPRGLRGWLPSVGWDAIGKTALATGALLAAAVLGGAIATSGDTAPASVDGSDSSSPTTPTPEPTATVTAESRSPGLLLGETVDVCSAEVPGLASQLGAPSTYAATSILPPDAEPSGRPEWLGTDGCILTPTNPPLPDASDLSDYLAAYGYALSGPVHIERLCRVAPSVLPSELRLSLAADGKARVERVDGNPLTEPLPLFAFCGVPGEFSTFLSVASLLGQ